MEDNTGAVRHGGAAKAGRFLCISQGGSGPFSRSSLTAEVGFCSYRSPPRAWEPMRVASGGPGFRLGCRIGLSSSVRE